MKARGVDRPVPLAVKVFRLEEVGDRSDRLAIDQERPEDRPLGLDVRGNGLVDRRIVEGHSGSTTTLAMCTPCSEYSSVKT